MRDIDPILYNKISKIENDLLNVGGGEFNPLTLPLNIEYFYESFNYKGLSNLTSSTNASYINFIPNASTLSGGASSFGVGYALIGTTNIYKPYIRVNGTSLSSYLATFVGLSPSITNATINYGNNIEITYQTTISIDNFLDGRQYSVGLGNPSNSSTTLGGRIIYFAISLNINSGKFQLCQMKDGVITFVNTNNTITTNTRYTLKIIYNTQTNVASFYINNTYINQLSIDIGSADLRPFFFIKSTTTTQSTISNMFIHNIISQVKYL